MFTGIIRHMGRIAETTTQEDASILLTIEAPFSNKLSEGDSVAVNGACLTVLSHTSTHWTCRLMEETIKKTTLSSLPVGQPINLELPAKAGDRLDGHIVQGHVDGVANISAIENQGDDRIHTITPPFEFLQYIKPKGSIALDGVSLTVVETTNTSFTVSLMPYTLSHTNLGAKKVGSTVNIETDKMQQPTWHTGTAVRGEGRGTALGFPTANIALDEYSPAVSEGIYACRAIIGNNPTLYAGALHAGPRPSFPGIAPSVELHLLHFPQKDLYGERIRFACIQKIRDIAKFTSIEDLTIAIAEDVNKATAILLA